MSKLAKTSTKRVENVESELNKKPPGQAFNYVPDSMKNLSEKPVGLAEDPDLARDLADLNHRSTANRQARSGGKTKDRPPAVRTKNGERIDVKSFVDLGSDTMTTGPKARKVSTKELKIVTR